VPQYLDLAMDTYEAIREKEGRAPRPDEFDANLGKLLERFLAYVGDTRRAALFVLSVPETFDRARFADLMATFHTGVPADAEGLRSLTQFSFVDEPEPGRYALHALVREALAARHDTEERAAIHRHLLTRAEETLAEATNLTITDAHRRALREGFAHARAVLTPEAFSNWYWQTEKPFDQAAEWELMQPLTYSLLDHLDSTLNPDHPATLGSVNNLAFLLRARGDLDGAEPLFRRALASYEAKLGPEHPDTLRSVNNLAFLLQARGDLDGAEPLFRRALAGFEKKLGLEHPNTRIVHDNLAALLRARGEYGGAAG
jgi:tetratricopeptide (TPR) repeat protein